jgi:hypothetical protein
MKKVRLNKEMVKLVAIKCIITDVIIYIGKKGTEHKILEFQLCYNLMKF